MPLKALQLNLTNRPAVTFANGSMDDMYDLDAPYQRGSVWGAAQRVALIKSMLLRLPTGAIYINVRDMDLPKPYVVIDGKQRILAIRAFHANEYGVPADWFADNELTAPIDGDTAYFSDLNLLGRNRIMHATIATYEAHVKTVEDEAEIFMLVNTGGIAQTAETLANAESFTGR
jgi:hypothetical protein